MIGSMWQGRTVCCTELTISHALLPHPAIIHTYTEVLHICLCLSMNLHQIVKMK